MLRRPRDWLRRVVCCQRTNRRPVRLFPPPPTARSREERLLCVAAAERFFTSFPTDPTLVHPCMPFIPPPIPHPPHLSPPLFSRHNMLYLIVLIKRVMIFTHLPQGNYAQQQNVQSKPHQTCIKTLNPHCE